MKCAFGCNLKACHQFNNGKWCCSSSSSSCPAIREKNSKSLKGRNPFENREHPRGMLGKTGWKKGKTAASCPVIAKSVETMKATKKANPAAAGFTKGSKHSEESLEKIRAGSSGNGGYRPGSGRGKKGWYKGIQCDSSWELAFVLWCELRDRPVKRATKIFQYRYKGKLREYHPDFRYKTADGAWKYLEIKGYISEQWLAKKAAFPKELLVISTRGMQRHILPEVTAVYGKDFIRLYEARVRKGKSTGDENGLENRRVRNRLVGSTPIPSAKKSSVSKFQLEVAARREAREAVKHKSYAGNKNSQYGTFWITNGIDNKKWSLDKGKLPRGFAKGRT